MKLNTYTTLAIAAIALATVPAIAQVRITKDGRPERMFRPIQGLNPRDVHFLRQAAIINMAEIQMSQMAIEKSSNPFVSEYAKEMIHEHQGSLDELMIIAANKSVELPGAMPDDVKKLCMHLQNLTGDRFDAAYQNAQVSGHADASRTFKSEIENGKDEDVKAYAVKTLPEVTLHYRMILNKQTMMGPNKMDHGN